MHVLTFLSVTLLLSAPALTAQQKDAPPGNPPNLWLASASAKDGKVIVQIAYPVEQGGTGGRVIEPGVGTLPATTVMRWLDLPKLTLGKTVQAFRVNGKPVEPDAAVLKALAKPTGVAVFVRMRGTDPVKPDAFYLALLREDTLVLVADSKDIYPSEP